MKDLDGHESITTAVAAARAEVRGSRDLRKIGAAIGVWCGALAFLQGQTRVDALHALLASLCHSFPKVGRELGDR